MSLDFFVSFVNSEFRGGGGESVLFLDDNELRRGKSRDEREYTLYGTSVVVRVDKSRERT